MANLHDVPAGAFALAHIAAFLRANPKKPLRFEVDAAQRAVSGIVIEQRPTPQELDDAQKVDLCLEEAAAHLARALDVMMRGGCTLKGASNLRGALGGIGLVQWEIELLRGRA